MSYFRPSVQMKLSALLSHRDEHLACADHDLGLRG
jgi:hypothetical protein